MKHGKKPTVKQRKLMQKWEINWENWLVITDGPDEMVIQHRLSDQIRRIPKYREED